MNSDLPLAGQEPVHRKAWQRPGSGLDRPSRQAPHPTQLSARYVRAPSFSSYQRVSHYQTSVVGLRFPGRGNSAPICANRGFAELQTAVRALLEHLDGRLEAGGDLRGRDAEATGGLGHGEVLTAAHLADLPASGGQRVDHLMELGDHVLLPGQRLVTKGGMVETGGSFRRRAALAAPVQCATSGNPSDASAGREPSRQERKCSGSRTQLPWRMSLARLSLQSMRPGGGKDGRKEQAA